MRSYDPSKPLIFSHIPKTAGTSVREMFSKWFGSNLLLHYKDKSRPPVHDLGNPPEPGKSVGVYGHFNRDRGFGIEKYYPQVDQFVTILRDPFERALSSYFFKTQNESMRRAFWGTAMVTLDDYIAHWPTGFLRPLDYRIGNFLPGGLNHDNYKSVFDNMFIEVGVTEHLDISLRRIADKLGFDFDGSQLQHLNAARRTHDVSESAKEKFKARNALEYEIYNYARDRLLKTVR